MATEKRRLSLGKVAFIIAVAIDLMFALIVLEILIAVFVGPRD